jgi:ligand-binding SRPBCC domain-containing protein
VIQKIMVVSNLGVVVPTGRANQPGNGEELARSVNPFGVPKRVVWNAYKHVQANQGAESIDRQTIEPELEQFFHPDSFGFRPGKSALQAVRVTQERC